MVVGGGETHTAHPYLLLSPERPDLLPGFSDVDSDPTLFPGTFLSRVMKGGGGRDFLGHKVVRWGGTETQEVLVSDGLDHYHRHPICTHIGFRDGSQTH